MKRTFMSLLLLLIGILFSSHAWAFPAEVASITPADNATDIPLNTTVTVVFNTDMDNTTITATNFYIKKGGSGTAIAATVTYDASTRTATLTPSANLLSNTSYTIYLSRYIKTSAGTRINSGSTYSGYSFTTHLADTIPPVVTITSPANGAIGIARTSRITATFSEDIDQSTLTTSSFSVNNGVTGTITYNSTTYMATFTPSSLLNYSTTYTVTITTAIKDLDGNNMAANKVWTFTTLAPDTTPPTVLSVSPAAGATSIDPATAVNVVFSEAMDPSSITTTSFTLNNGVTGTVGYNAATNTATFTPSAALAGNTTYTATISTAVTDVAGNTMTSSKVWSFTTSGNNPVTAVPLNTYCQTPPFVTSGANALKPNVLLMVDNSGSMNEFAYKTAGSGDSSYDQSYNSATDYFGYFDSNKMYSYSTSASGYFYVDSTKTLDRTKFSATSGFSGNMLNWLTMRRVDVVRKVLVGGKTQPRSANTANYLFPTNNPDRNYYKQYGTKYFVVSDNLYTCSSSSCGSYSGTYNLKVYVGDQLPQDGLLLQMQDRINFGIMFFNDGYKFEDKQNSVRDGGYVAVNIGATGTNLITQIENTDPSTWTPLAETLYEATRYFQDIDSAFNGGTYPAGQDPIAASCMKNFMLILTDGESTKDQNLPGTAFTTNHGTVVTDPYGFNIKTYMDKIAANDGTTSKWNVAANTDEGSWYLPGVALYAHTTDLRSATMGRSNLPGMQNLGIYVVFAFDDSATGRTLLKMTAKYGGFDDANMTSASLPDSPDKWGKCDSSGIVDYDHCTPNTYYEAQQGGQLQTALQNAFNDILSKVSSGTSASIVNNRGESGANLFQAVFYPKKSYGSTDLYWIGELQNMWYYLDPYLNSSSIREDTNYDKKLDLKADYKVTVDYDTTKNQTVANWFKDTSGTGTFTFMSTGSPDNIHALWRAGGLLHYRSDSSRTIKTTLGSYNSTYLTDTVSASGTGLTDFTTANDASILTYLNVSDQATADKYINYTRGLDYTNDTAYRSRTTSITYPAAAPAPLNTTVSGVWKLGDIISSTPQAQTSKQLQSYDAAYFDTSYSLFYNSNDYKNRNMVYTAANDGMLHAFRVGVVTRTPYDSSTPNTIARITNPDNSLNMGDEEWAFIPKNALPYLKYLADPAYNHLYYVNDTVTLVDASINRPSTTAYTCTQAEYWKCEKKTTYSTGTSNLDPDNTSWRTVLIGGMGQGGASRDYNGYCNKADGTTPTSSAQETRLDCVKSPIAGTGLSSFFALDISVPQSPKFMWEFSDAVLPAADKGLGYSTSGPAIVRISTRDPVTATYGTPNLHKNGRWFAVFATGPSGPIDTTVHQFMGRSDNELKVYVVDMHPDMSGGWVKGTNYWVFDSGIANAFAGDLTDTVIDVDRWNSSANGYYSDDVVYIGYTKPLAGTSPVEWTDGGVLRLLTNDSLDPADWTLSTMIDGIGPVTSSPTKLQDRNNGKMWLFFGTGRYFYKTTSGQDDPTNSRHLLGVMETCYDGGTNKMNSGIISGAKQGCGQTAPATLGFGDLQDQSTTIVTTLPSGKKGWFITLDPPGNYAMGAQMTTAAYDAERVTTNTTAAFNGVVTYTTFKPTDDLCGYGGSTLVWLVDYLSGGVPPASTMKGKLLVQLSGGEFVTLDLATATKAGNDATQQTRGDRRIRADLAGHGIAGGRGGSLQSLSKPVRRILQIMEK